MSTEFKMDAEAQTRETPILPVHEAMAFQFLKMMLQGQMQPSDISAVMDALNVRVQLIFCDKTEDVDFNVDGSSDYVKDTVKKQWDKQDALRAEIKESLESADPLQAMAAQSMMRAAHALGGRIQEAKDRKRSSH